MIQLTLEQITYKERTLHQLRTNQARLEASLERESRPEVIQSIEDQLNLIEAHINRLEDELAGNVVFDEPVAEEYFKHAVRALANERFYLAKKYIHRLETIEPFYPALERLRQEAESGQVSRRTRSIAQGTATTYPGISLAPVMPGAPAAVALPGPAGIEEEGEGERIPWYRFLFQIHILASCLVIALLGCVMLGVFGVTLLEWFIESL
jgi:hypothetical protein